MATASFNVPPVDRELPDDLQPELEASVKRFEGELGIMAGWARSSGYIEKFRAEAKALLLKGYDSRLGS